MATRKPQGDADSIVSAGHDDVERTRQKAPQAAADILTDKKIEFNIGVSEGTKVLKDRVDITASVVDAMQKGMRMVWEKHFPREGVNFKGTVYNRLMNPVKPKDVLEDVIGDSNTGTGSFQVALNTIHRKLFRALGEDMEVCMLVVGAMIAMGKVQSNKGQTTSPTQYDASGIITSNGIGEQGSEDEKWNEALDVLKCCYPTAQGTIFINEREYTVPASSTYSKKD